MTARILVNKNDVSVQVNAGIAPFTVFPWKTYSSNRLLRSVAYVIIDKTNERRAQFDRLMEVLGTLSQVQPEEVANVEKHHVWVVTDTRCYRLSDEAPGACGLVQPAMVRELVAAIDRPVNATKEVKEQTAKPQDVKPEMVPATQPVKPEVTNPTKSESQEKTDQQTKSVGKATPIPKR